MRALFVLFALFALSYAQDTITCATFCAAANSTCPGLYTVNGNDVCQYICMLYPAGAIDDDSGDSVACRYNALLMANTTTGPTHDLYCSYAGPLGGTAEYGYMCGDIYNFYCDVLFTTLPVPCKAHGYKDLGECVVDARENIATVGGFEIETTASGDDIECRLTYAVQGMNSVLTGLPYTQCDKAYWYGAQATATPSTNCQNDTFSAGDAPCVAFCNAFQNTCQFDKDDENSFENFDDCLNTCSEFSPETSLANEKDSVGCRRYQVVLAANAEADQKAEFCDAAAAAKSPVCREGAAFGLTPLLGLVAALISFLFVL